MVDKRDKSKSIQPLDGGYGGYIETLEGVRNYVDSKSTLTRERLKSWYSKKYRTGTKTSDAYMNSLFRSGLLREHGGRIECTFPDGMRRYRRIIEIIDGNIVYVLDMLYEAQEGATEERLHKLGKSKYGLSKKSNVNQIWWRRGWLQSARLLERREGKLYATKRGRTILDDRFDRRASRRRDAINASEFGGRGEGVNHRTLKEFVCRFAEKVCDAKLDDCSVEYPLLSGDKVDVTASNTKKVWHMEIKSCTSEDPDLVRGLYQCIKYGAVGNAMESARNSNRIVESLLVVESKLSERVRRLADKLDVCVYRLPAPMRRELRRARRKHP